MSGHQSEQTHDRAKNTGVLSRAMHLPLCSGGPNGNSAPSHSTPGHSAPGHSAPSHSAPSQSTPSDSTPSHSAPSQSTPSDSAPSQSTPSDSAPSQSTPSDSAPSQSTPSDSTPSDSTPSQSTPSDSAPSQSTPSDSAPSDSTPSQSTPSDSAPSQSTPSDSTPSDSAPSDSAPSQSTPSDSAPSQSTPSDSAPSDSAPSDSAPSQSTPSDSAPSQSTPSDSTPSDSAPSDSAPSQSTPSDSAPSQSTPSDSAPSQSTPSDSTPSDSTPSDSAPSQSTPSDSAPSQSTPSDSAPSDSAPSDSAPSQSTPSDSAPSQSTPSDSTPSDSAPSDSAPSDSAPSQSTPSDSAPSQSTHSDSTPSDSTLSDSTPSQSTHRDSTPSHSAPSDSAPSHSAPSDSTPSDSTLSDSTPSQSTHRDSTPSDSAPSDSAPSHSAPSDSAPSQSTPSDSAPSQSTHSDSTPSDSTLSDSTPSQSTHRDSALSDSAPCDSALSHSPPCNRAPRDSTPRDSTPSHSAPSHSAPSQSTPSHSAPSHSPPCNRAPRDSAPSHSESPDSMRSISSLSSRSTDSTLEAESRQLCLNQGNINAAQRGNTLTNELFSSGHFHSQPRDGDVDRSSVESVPNGKSFSAYLDPNTGSRSDNLAFLMTGSQQYGGDQGDCSLEDSGRSTGMSPDSALREGPVGSAEPTHRSSCKNELVSLASVSSDEREMRSNHSGLNGSDSNKREQQVYSRGPTPAEGRTFLAPVSGQPDISSMEPQLGSGNQTFCDPSSTVPPLHDDVGCVENCPDRNLREQQVSNTPGGMRKPTSASRKTEIKRFPKPDFKNVRSKIMSRPANPSRASNSADVKSKPSRSVQSGEKRPIFTHKKVFQREEEGRNRSKPETPSNRNKANVAKSQSGRLDRSSTLRTQPGSSTVRTQPGSSTLRTQPGSSTLRTQPGSSTLSTKSNKDTQVSSQEDLLVKRTPSGPPSSLPCKGAVNNNMSPPEDRIETEAARRESKNGKTASRSKELLMGKGSRVESCAENREVEVRTAAASERSKTRLGQRPPPGSGRGSSPAQAPAANLRLPPPVSKAKLGTSSKYGRTAGNMSPQRIRQISTAGNPRMRLTERAPATVAERSKRPPHPGPTAMRPTATSRLPVKSQDPLRSPSCPSLASVCSEPCATTRAAPGTNVTRSRPNDKPGPPHAAGGVGRAPSTKLGGVRPHVPSHQGRGTPAAPAPGCKAAALTGSKTVAGPLLRAGSAGFQYQAVAPAVDKNKPRVSPRGQPPPVSGQPDLLPPDAKPLGVDHYRAQNPQKSDYIQQLKNLLNFSNRRFEAVAVVIQRVFQQREEALKRSEELSHELVTLQGELVSSATLNERLGREKDELRVAFEGVLQKVQDQHQCDLADLEERLRTFYSAEWEKVHEAYQEEADKYKKQVQQQVEELRSKHEALRRDLEASHAQKMESVKLQYETSFEELRKVHEQDMLALDKTLKESETTLSEQIRELTKENDALSEKLKEEANRRKMLAEKNQKDSHTLYLEQELDSLKVVLDIKTEQLHQQGKKLIQMDKLMERNVQLDECLQKVQQENEELKARMDKHAALSRQLSTEQAVLQESLQKESKVNKRLSMENEELLWKLHNGDLGSPRKLSPSSPSVSLQSPRNSALFSSGLGSPR